MREQRESIFVSLVKELQVQSKSRYYKTKGQVIEFEHYSTSRVVSQGWVSQRRLISSPIVSYPCSCCISWYFNFPLFGRANPSRRFPHYRRRRCARGSNFHKRYLFGEEILGIRRRARKYLGVLKLNSEKGYSLFFEIRVKWLNFRSLFHTWLRFYKEWAGANKGA